MTSTVPADPVAAKTEETKTQTQSEGNNQSKDDTKPEKVTTTTGKDSANKSEATTKNASKSSGPNKRTFNPLGDFSSYTYRISMYAMPPEAVTRYANTGRFDNKDLFLIVQSSGINNEGAKSGSTGNITRMDSQRGKGFELDFYIDDLEIETLSNAKDTGIASNSVNFKFKIIEPYGMTFPTKLVAQQIDLQNIANMKRPVKEQIEALQGHYLISIRFYGYDSNGQLVTNSMYGGSASAGATNIEGVGSSQRQVSSAPLDANATFERNFPIVINKFQFRLDGKSTVYDINAKLVSEQVAYGGKRGLVVETLSCQGETVSDMLGGFGGSTGLLDQLNKAQTDLVEKGSQEIADEFQIMFDSEELRKASLIDDKQINKDRVPMADISQGGAVKTSLTVNSKTMRKSRTMSFSAGLPITQAIDQIVTQSKFITDALTYTDSEESQQPQSGDSSDEVNAKPKVLQWYIVAPTVSILGWDNLRNDYAYKTTYVIKAYDIPYVKAGNVKSVPRYPGPHKIYNYWYTGKNSEVLAYEQNYNLLYFNAAALSSQNSGVDLASNTPIYQRAAQGADSTGKPSGSFDSINSVKTFLYSPKDQLHAKIRILGDPDFLMPATSGNPQQIMQQWYGEDFTINPNTGQIFIELIFKQVEDYSNATGLLKPNGNIDFWDFSDNPAMKSMAKGMIFMVVKVTSRFSRGMFTQEFKTIIPNFNELGKPNKSESATQREGAANGKATGAGNNSLNNPFAPTSSQFGAFGESPTGGAGRGGQGGPNAAQAALNYSDNPKKFNPYQTANKLYQVSGVGATPDDDQIVIQGSNYKKTYTQANFYNGDLEREHAKRPDPANQSSRYSGLNSNAGGGRGVVNP